MPNLEVKDPFLTSLYDNGFRKFGGGDLDDQKENSSYLIEEKESRSGDSMKELKEMISKLEYDISGIA